MLEFIGAIVVLLSIVGGLALWVAAASLFNGYVLTKMWAWFIVPTFGLRPLRIVEAIGIACIVSLLTARHVGTDKNATKSEKASAFLMPFATSGLALLFAWIVKHWM